MKGMKGRILKKLRSIPEVGYLIQGRDLRLTASDELLEPPLPPPLSSNRALCDLPVCRADQNLRLPDPSLPPNPDIVDHGEKEPCDNKENIRPSPSPECSGPRKKKSPGNQESKLDVPSFRRPDLNSETLFDPDLLAAFEQAVTDHIRSFEESRTKTRPPNEEDPYRDEGPPTKIPRVIDDDHDPPMDLKEKCPPGGRGSVILYTTSLRGIRKTFEDCNSIRFLLESSKVLFYERDISMHMEFREELWGVLGGRSIPPRLFIKGRYIGGADEVVGLHEQGRLLPLLRGMPVQQPGRDPCEGCGGMRFMMCYRCNGGRKIYDDERAMAIQCHHCNENGLILCPICC